MKRIYCLILMLVLFLCGCSISGDRLQEPVTFYYIRSAYQEDMGDVIAAEQREAAGHREDLSYLLALYLMGPTDIKNVSPIPRGTNIFRAEQIGTGVVLQLSDTERTMTDVEFSLACTCLSMTCMELTDAEKVTINSGSRSMTITSTNLILTDSVVFETEDTQ